MALATAGALGAASLSTLFARSAGAANMTGEETANIELVKKYMAAWMGPNPKLEDLVFDLAEDCYVTINPGPTEPLVGREAVMEAFKPFLAMGEGFELEVTEAHALGPSVFVKRMDYSMKGGKRGDAGSPAVGLLVVADGKIKYWHDYAFSHT